MTTSRLRAAMMLALMPAVLDACSDLFKVTNPGPTNASDLNALAAAPAVVAGIAYQVSFAAQGVYTEGAVVTQEIHWAGTANTYDNGGHASNTEDDANWSDAQGARWTAEHGVTRLKTSLGTGYATSLFSARANLLAGFANRMLGENFCQAVIDGGPAQDRSIFFQRARQNFTDALTIETAAHDSSYVFAALGGRAAVEAWLGDWTSAVTDASPVPIGYEYDATYNGGSLVNQPSYDTHTVQSITVDSSFFQADSLDPRTPSTMTGQPSGNGSTPFQAQLKYPTDGAGMALTKGTEMWTLRAEAALLNNDISAEIGLLNDVRAFYGVPGGPLAAPSDAATAWADLRSERGHTLWLEGRRLWDLGRWFAATGPEHDDTLINRAKCLPIGATELQTNPNLSGH